MTVKRYEQDPYLKSLKATVMSCDEIEQNGNKKYLIVLDQTIFFPEGGGQSPDKGTINGSNVMDVQIKEDCIFHTVLKPFEVGEEVEEKLDWKHRFSNMQQHSGEHIFSGIVYQKYGYRNVGFHLSDQIVTMDFSGPLSEKQIEEIELEVNKCIADNTPVHITYPSKEELEHIEYRSKIAIEGQVRIVSIPEYDVCACCGTHVRSCGEIGLLKVQQSQNYKGGTRISILCGFRAIEDYNKKQQSVFAISNLLSAPKEEIVESVEKLQNEKKELKQQLLVFQQEYMMQRLKQFENDDTDLYLFEKSIDTESMRMVVNARIETHSGYCGVFVGNDEIGYRFIIGSKEKDAREIGKRLKEEFSAKGGGKPSMIQGSVEATEKEIRGIFK